MVSFGVGDKFWWGIGEIVMSLGGVGDGFWWGSVMNFCGVGEEFWLGWW